MNKKPDKLKPPGVKKVAKKPATKIKTSKEVVKIEQKEPGEEDIKREQEEPREEDIKLSKSATKIQTWWRVYRARKLLAQLRVDKEAMDEKLRKLEKEAYLRMIRIEQEREEREFEKRMREQAARKARETRRKKFLEAAYDGNQVQIEFLIDDYERELNADPKLDMARRKKLLLQDLIDCRDSNLNTPLSEAAAGGSTDVVKFLLAKKADPNSRGAFGRTPLWRGSFAELLELFRMVPQLIIKYRRIDLRIGLEKWSQFGASLQGFTVLLENGADPRLYTEDGQRCVDAATQKPVVDVLEGWDIKLTDRMLDQIAKSKLEARREFESSLEKRKREARSGFETSQAQFDRCKIELFKCRTELQRLNDEYLISPDMYRPLIEKKESERTILEASYEGLREKVVKSRIVYKDLMSEIKRERRAMKEEMADGAKAGQNSDSGSDSEDDGLDDNKVIKINIREMDDMIMRDLSDIIKSSADKWPLIIDQNEQAATFLRYRDTNYINALQPVAADRFRLALIGAVRYGKPFVLDLMQYDRELLEAVRVVCGQIHADLFDLMCTKKITENESYMRFVKLENDGKEYEAHNFSPVRIKNFKVLFLTSNPYPCDELLRITIPVRIVSAKNFY